jgi:hypothetical protein
MQTLEHDSGAGQLARAFAEADARLKSLEQGIARGQTRPLAATVEEAIVLVRDLMAACIMEGGSKAIPAPAADLLEVFKTLVKGEPSWHAIRDNCRELVYYRNCINMERADALPQVPEKMAVRTARHVYLYVRTRCIQEGRLQD